MFSPTFSTYGDDGWEVSEKVWLYWPYWAVTVIITTYLGTQLTNTLRNFN